MVRSDPEDKLKTLVLLTMAALPAFSGVIDFDALADGAVITNQFAGVVFSSTVDAENKATNQPSYNGSMPNFLCTGPVGGGVDCAGETIVDFSAPVNALSFQGMGINDVSANVAQVDVFTNGVFASTITVAGNAEGFNPVLVDLSAFVGVTRLRIHSITDGGGVGWDTFRFDETAVPEPTTFCLAALGCVAAGLARRKRG